MSAPDNIFPMHDQLVTRQERESLASQRAHAYWMCGLSGSGKSTIAKRVERRLFADGHRVIVLDGDNIRSGINSNLGFSTEDRAENIRRVAEVSKLFISAGFIVIVSFISPTQEIRDLARDIIGSDDFSEIYVHATFETCASRDVKGLYAKAIAGEIKNFTGLDSPFDIPSSPLITLDTENQSVDQCAAELTAVIKSTSITR